MGASSVSSTATATHPHAHAFPPWLVSAYMSESSNLSSGRQHRLQPSVGRLTTPRTWDVLTRHTGPNVRRPRGRGLICMSPLDTTDPRRRLQPAGVGRRRESASSCSRRTLDRTHVNEIIKRAGICARFFDHYFPPRWPSPSNREYEILHLHGLVEQTALTLEGASPLSRATWKPGQITFERYTGGLDQDLRSRPRWPPASSVTNASSSCSWASPS